MTIQEGKKFLKEKDYKIDGDHAWKRTTGSDCQCNDRPPNISIEFWSHSVDGKIHESMEIKIRAETTSGDWCNIGWYGLSIDRLDSLSEFEYLIEKMWETLN